jgi:hypothetical protein
MYILGKSKYKRNKKEKEKEKEREALLMYSGTQRHSSICRFHLVSRNFILPSKTSTLFDYYSAWSVNSKTSRQALPASPLYQKEQ